MKYAVRELQTERDEFGPEHVYEVFDSKTGPTIGWVVVDNTARSPEGTGKGGTAMYPSCDLEITKTKGRVMTWKQIFCVPIGKNPRYNPWGGAKGGIRYDSSLPDAEKVLRGWARALFEHGVIPQRYIFGLDVGLKEWATKAVVEELGSRKVSTGKPTNLGGIPYDELGVTGYGLALTTDLMAQARGIDVRNPAVTIGYQGFGAVGYGTATWFEKLYPGGAKIVAVSDIQGSIYCDAGLTSNEYKTILAKPIDSSRLPRGVKQLQLGEELHLPLDILILGYKEDQITTENMDRISARIVVEGANRGISDAAEKYLWHNNVLSLTDFTINCGASSIVYVEHANGSVEDGFEYVQEVITTNVAYLLEEARKSTLSPRELAEEIAKDEVRKAMAHIPRDAERSILS